MKTKTTNGKAHVRTIPELAERLGRTFQHLYALERDNRFKKTTHGYHVENIRKILAQKTGISGAREEALNWDIEYRKWKAKKAKREYAEAVGVLVNKNQATAETIKRETEFVRALRRLPFDLPPRLHQQPFEEYGPIIDRAVSEILESIVQGLQPPPPRPR